MELKLQMRNQPKIYKENHLKAFIKTFGCQMNAVLYDFYIVFEQDQMNSGVKFKYTYFVTITKNLTKQL